MTFEPGKKYRRREEIHDIYGGQRQGGISTPSAYPMIFIFTGDQGSAYGYSDQFRPDGSFWYTGEGQKGRMEMVRGNRAIKDHQKNNKTIHLFEYIKVGLVQYVGQAVYLGHHREDRPDVDNVLRPAIVFELEIDTSPNQNKDSRAEPLRDIKSPEKELKLWSRPLSEIRALAKQGPKHSASSKERRVITYQRSEAVRVYVLRRAKGVCEGCGSAAPFRTKKGRPYLEPHHIRRLSDGGPDDPRWVAAICPNCHREAHYGENGEVLNQQLSERLEIIET